MHSLKDRANLQKIFERKGDSAVRGERIVHATTEESSVSQMMAQIRELQNKVNSLSDAGKFYDPESGSSSGATHVPDRTSIVLSPRTLPRCDSGLPRDTLNGTGMTGNVFERPRPQEGLSSSIFHSSKNFGILLSEIEPRQQGERVE